MQVLQQVEEVGTIAVKKLRIQKLNDGIPFMINSGELPDGQCYLEYPDGSIQLVSIVPGGRDFIPVRTLTKKEAATIRTKYNLL